MAIHTIYRELDRARALSLGTRERGDEDDGFGDVDADWTLIDDQGDLHDEEISLESISGIGGQAMEGLQTGPATLALGSMVLSPRRRE